jgi:serine/threonine protein kinase
MRSVFLRYDNNRDLVIKLGDFGLAALSSTDRTTYVGTRPYLPPVSTAPSHGCRGLALIMTQEINYEFRSWTPKSDIYAMGCETPECLST